MRRATTKQCLGLAVVVLPSLVFPMDLTVLSLALPRIALALSTTSVQLLAIADISTICLALTLIVAGWAIGGDIAGCYSSACFSLDWARLARRFPRRLGSWLLPEP